MIPQQRDIISINVFPLNVEKEANKRIKALVLSREAYSRSTGYVVVTPVTQLYQNPSHFPLKGYKTTGFIATAQINSIDFTPQGKRNISFIERMEEDDFMQVQQMVQHIFGFSI